MGCDIHLYTERIRCVDGKDQWVNCDYWQLNPYFPASECGEPELEIKPVYNDRDYQLFALLANVRNYGDIKPISEPRDLPIDVSAAVKNEFNTWECDAHSTSWFTLKELLNYKSKHSDGHLDTLITALITRFKAETWSQDDEAVLKTADRFRIVFWFDN